MITRYSRPDAVAIWSQETKYKIWFEIEAHAATKMAELGVIPAKAAETLWAKGKDVVWDADRIDEIERTTKHDVIAFLTHVSETVGEEARFLHQGMTSSDVLDTCFAVQLARSSDAVINTANADHVGSVLALLEGLRGSGKPLLHTSGSSVVGDDARGDYCSPHVFDEQTPWVINPFKQARRDIDLRVLAGAKDGIKTAVKSSPIVVAPLINFSSTPAPFVNGTFHLLTWQPP